MPFYLFYQRKKECQGGLCRLACPGAEAPRSPPKAGSDQLLAVIVTRSHRPHKGGSHVGLYASLRGTICGIQRKVWAVIGSRARGKKPLHKPQRARRGVKEVLKGFRIRYMRKRRQGGMQRAGQCPVLHHDHQSSRGSHIQQWDLHTAYRDRAARREYSPGAADRSTCHTHQSANLDRGSQCGLPQQCCSRLHHTKRASVGCMKDHRVSATTGSVRLGGSRDIFPCYTLQSKGS